MGISCIGDKVTPRRGGPLYEIARLCWNMLLQFVPIETLEISIKEIKYPRQKFQVFLLTFFKNCSII